MKQAKATQSLLLIDDSTMLGKRVINLIHDIPRLKISGQAITIKNGYEMIKKHQPDIVLLDLSMPDGNGFEVLSYLKTTQPATKVVIFSNSGDELHEKMAYKLKADRFLDKSRDFPQLIGVIEQMIDAPFV